MHSQLQESRGDGRADGVSGVLRRHRGWVLGSAFAGIVLSVVGAYLWPDTYRSSATLGNVGADPSALNDIVRRTMLKVEGRLALESVIGVYGLYPNERKRLAIEDVVENLKHQIKISDATPFSREKRNGAAFQISFEYPDRFKAQKVVQDLAARFMAEANPARGDTVLPQFLNDQAAAARKELEEAETKLEEFRTANEGLLPEQAEANQNKMTELETRRAKVRAGISSAQAEEATLEASVVSEQEKRRNIKEYIDVPAPSRAPSKQLADLDKQIQALEQRIKTLKLQYTDKFPDVIDAHQRLETIKNQRDTLAKEDAANAPGPARKLNPEAARVSAEIDANVKNFQGQIAAQAAAINELNKEAAEVDEDIQAMKARLKDMPANEKAYADLVRDRDLKKAQFDEAEIKSRATQEGQRSERGTGDVLVLEPVSIPESPISPHRGMIIGAGSFMGLLIGLILGGVRELRMPDEAFRGSTETARGGMPEWSIWALVIVFGVAAMTLSIGYYVIYRPSGQLGN